MRLSKRLKNAIVKAANQSFGEADIILFGSRTDDQERGGDIDLAIDSNLPHDQFCHLKAQFISNLLREDLDLKIDLVQLAEADALLRSEILSQGTILYP